MSSSELSLVAYGNKKAARSATTFLNSVFMSTVNAAAKTLVSVAKGNGAIVPAGVGGVGGKWRPGDHFRFMVMMVTWMTLWVLRVLMDHIPSCSSLALGYCSSAPFSLLQAFSPLGLIEFPSAKAGPATWDPQSSSSSSALSVSSLQMILNDGVEAVPVQALSRALSHILALLNEIPSSSRKYQFAMAMAERIMDGNAISGNSEMLEVNRVALSSAFDRTSSLLHRSLEKHRQRHGGSGDHHRWAVRTLRSLPLGSYVVPYVSGVRACVGAVKSLIATCRSTLAAAAASRRPQRRYLAVTGGDGRGCGGRVVWEEEEEEGGEVVAEKLAEELLWICHKLRAYGAVEEALLQWSYASSLASASLTTDPRLQGLIVKISAMLFGDMNREELEIPKDVKFRLLLLWLPLFCHAGNGFAYPVLTYFEKAEVERAIDGAIRSLAPMDQEVILTNWIQEYAISASDWPNLQSPYDHWCQSTRSRFD